MDERFDRDAHYRGVLEGAMARGAATVLPRPMAEDAPWYAVQAAARAEWIAMRELAGLGMSAFLPHVRGKRAHRGRMIATSDPLFPGYLFVRIGDGGFEGVRQADGVIGIVRVAERFAVLPEAVIEALKGRCDVSGCLLVAPAAAASAFTWAVGEVVRLTGGPFCGFQGAIAAVDKSDRVSVHIDIFGRPTPVTVSSGEVEKASPPRNRPRQGRRQGTATVTLRSAPGEQGREPC
jgi:transcriptional antiterminator RfaH